MDMENTPLNNDSEENSPVNVVPRLTMMTSPSTLEAARRPLSLEELSEETNGESSLNEEQISEVDEAELNPMDEEEVSSVAEDEPSDVDEEEPSDVDEDELHESEESDAEDELHESEESDAEDELHESEESDAEFLNECGEVDEEIRA